MELDVIKKIILLLEESNLKKIHLRDGDFEISLEKESSYSFSKEFPEKETNIFKQKKEKILKESEKKEEDYILSPMVGTFYTASAPDQMPFVKVGDEVNPDTLVGIIEAMKVMNEIKAGKKGIIKEILVENAQPVEFGTKLIYLES